MTSSQSNDEHLALLVEAADMLRGLQLTALKRLDLAARDGQSIFAHVRFHSSSLSEALARAKKLAILNHPARRIALRSETAAPA